MITESQMRYFENGPWYEVGPNGEHIYGGDDTLIYMDDLVVYHWRLDAMNPENIRYLARLLKKFMVRREKLTNQYLELLQELVELGGLAHVPLDAAREAYPWLCRGWDPSYKSIVVKDDSAWGNKYGYLLCHAIDPTIDVLEPYNFKVGLELLRRSEYWKCFNQRQTSVINLLDRLLTARIGYEFPRNDRSGYSEMVRVTVDDMVFAYSLPSKGDKRSSVKNIFWPGEKTHDVVL